MNFYLMKLPLYSLQNFVHPSKLTQLTTCLTQLNRNLYHERNIPKTLDEFKQFQFKPNEQPENARSLRVAIIGCPNAGKSTLLNQLINWKISAVSSKVHTTRKNVIGIYVENNTQLEFIDTPGLVSRKHMMRHKLELSFANDLKISAGNADIIAMLVDISNRRERSKLNQGILDLLQQYHNNENKESLLVLNKVDKIRDKRSLLDIVSTLTNGIVDGQPVSLSNIDDDILKAELKQGKFDMLFQRTDKYYKEYQDKNIETVESDFKHNGIGWPKFSQVFMISALHNDGIQQLRKYFLQKAKEKSWFYSGNVVTVQNPKQIIIDTIREVCLELFNQEIPYNFRYQIVMWEQDDLGNLYLVVDILCPEKFLSLLIGPKGLNISNIVRKARESLSNIFHCDISLKIAAKSFR